MTGFSRIPAVQAYLKRIPINAPFLVLAKGDSEKIRKCLPYIPEDPMGDMLRPSAFMPGDENRLILDADETLLLVELIDYYERRRRENRIMSSKVMLRTESGSRPARQLFSDQAATLDAAHEDYAQQLAVLTTVFEGGLERAKVMLN